MNINVLLLLLPGLIALSIAENFVKIKGTSGEFSDIVIDSNGRWYIIKDKKLCSSLDKGKTCNEIDIPTKELMYLGIGIDKFDNIYVQDHKLTVFVIAPTINENFVSEEIGLAYGKEKLVSRPFGLGENTVYLASKSGLMQLENGATTAEKVSEYPESRTEMTQLIRSNSTYFYGVAYEIMYYSGGGPRYWIYAKSRTSSKPLCQTISFVKRMNAVQDRIYCIVDGEKKIKVIHVMDKEFEPFLEFVKKSYVTTIEGIDTSNINAETDFTIQLPENNFKTYIYGNIGNTGIVYELSEKYVNRKNITEVASMHRLDNVRILSSAMQDDKVYLGTSDGVYEFTDIQPKRVIGL